jgi:hypothetical protein
LGDKKSSENKDDSANSVMPQWNISFADCRQPFSIPGMATCPQKQLARNKKALQVARL